MTDTKYNGWTNYSTWRVQLEVMDGLDPEHFDLEEGEAMTLVDVHELADAMQSYAEEVIFSGLGYDERRPSNLMEDYARAFLSDVNWYEIATHFVDNFKETA
jgi:hypothetical protein